MSFDRDTLVEWYRRNRRLSRELFEIATPEAYYDRPIALRNPICFYEGHLPAFSVNTLLKRALHEPGVDAQYEVLFERGIDPEDEAGAGNGSERWPARGEILAYGERADERVLEALQEKPIAVESDELRRGGLAAYTILEHEPMHQETLRYMWHRLPFEKKKRPTPADKSTSSRGGAAARQAGVVVRIPAGVATLGAQPERIRFGWDNEFPQCRMDVPAFEIDADDVTNAGFLEFVQAGAYRRRELWSDEGWDWITRAAVKHPLFWEQDSGGGDWLWRGMFERTPLAPDCPVYVSHAEAEAFAKWRGRRLPTEAEFHRAAYGTPEGRDRPYPWGEESPDSTRGNFDFQKWDPVPIGSYPAGDSAWGVRDLIGNGWEWTSTVFAPFPGFRPMPTYPQYSADFFDGRHYVMKGASPATAKELVRSSFRNWFRGNYPYVYATFRCAR